MRALSLALFTMFAAQQAHAQSIEVAPVSVTLGAGQLVTSLTITNRGPAPIAFQVRPYSWSQADNLQKLEPTADIAVSPPLAEIAPGQAQFVRVLLRNQPTRAEVTYRIIIDELPPPATPGKIRVALRLSLPLFAVPANPVTSALTWRIMTNASGSFLEAQNRGTAHTRILSGAFSADGRAPMDVRTSKQPYVLAGSFTRWNIEPVAGLRPGTTARLKMTTDTGPLEAAATIVSASP